jgi:integrase
MMGGVGRLGRLLSYREEGGTSQRGHPTPLNCVAWNGLLRERVSLGGEDVESAHRRSLGAAIREAETDGIPWEPDPTKKVKHAPKEEHRRTKIGPDVAAAFRLLILTGARLREILHLRWEYVDMERGLVFLPDSKTGRKTIILNAPALAVLAGLPHLAPSSFPARHRAERPNQPMRGVTTPSSALAPISSALGNW